MCSLTGLRAGGVDRIMPFEFSHLDEDFRATNAYLLSAKRGAGAWVWKPQIILQAMRQADEGDIIVYSDSATEFVGPLKGMIETCSALEHGVLGMLVGPEFRERAWTKRDLFVHLDCDQDRYWGTPQLRSGLMAIRNIPPARQFVREWGELTRQVRLVSDLPSICGKPELDGFIAHRHDQSIFSLLYKKRGYQTWEALSGRGLDGLAVQQIEQEPSVMACLPSYLDPRMTLRRVSPRPGKLA